MRRTCVPLVLVACITLISAAPAPAAAQPNPDLLKQSAVLELPGMASIPVDTGLVFREVGGQVLKLDLFHPATGRKTAKARRSPLVIFVNGVGIAEPPLRRWGIYQSWGRLVAVSGMAAITHDARRDAPREDLEALVAHVRQNAERYQIDPDQIGIWACSANLQHGSWYALNPANAHVKAAVFYYGNIDTTHLRTDLPVLVGRAGLDNVGINASMDGFVQRALRRNATLTLVNLPNGRHAFDLFDPDETSRDAVRATLAFLRSNLAPEMQEARRARDAQRRAVDRHAARDWEGTIAAATSWLEKESETGRSGGQGRQLMGDAFYNLRRFGEAGEAYERAGDKGWNVAVSYYNAACSWALAGNRERALSNIEKAVGTGFVTDRRGMANDPDFASIKDDPRFRKLLETP